MVPGLVLAMVRLSGRLGVRRGRGALRGTRPWACGAGLWWVQGRGSGARVSMRPMDLGLGWGAASMVVEGWLRPWWHACARGWPGR
eukprot:7980252-Heterocapsa_arctica.AAC.1